jgi:hypothetical protein
MTTRMAKTATVATVALGVVAVLLAYSAFVVPASAQTDTNNTASSTSSSSSSSLGATPSSQGHWGVTIQAPGGPDGPFPGAFRGGLARGGWGPLARSGGANLSVGQTFTVTSTSGRYAEIGSPGTNGTASGSVTFTVTGRLTGGYTVAIASGSLTVAGTTYTISSGSAQMGRDAASMVGQGVTTPTGEFLLTASAHGTFAGTTSRLSLDLSSGSTEYLVSLVGTISS